MGGGGSGRLSVGRSDELLVECMLSMASVDDDGEEDVEAASGQLSFVEFERMITQHWPTAVVSQ